MASKRIPNDGGEVDEHVLRQIEPHPRRGHVFEIGPDQVAMTVIDAEVAAHAGDGRARMTDY